jgi:Protein of unknown function (DUF1573)
MRFSQMNSWKTLVFQTVWIVLGVGSLFGQAKATKEAAVLAPKIQFEEMIHDFGRVRSGAIMKHEFSFTNSGNADLIIENVLPACGCTTITEFTRTIPPGGKASLTLEFNSHSLQGEQIKTMLVKSNDPIQPNLVLQLKGLYWMPIEIYPLTALLFLPPHTDQKLSTTIRIVNQTDQPLKLEAPVSSVPQLTARVLESTPGKEFHVVVDTVPPFPHKDIQATIKLATNSAETPSIELNIVVIAQPEILITPTQMFLPVELPPVTEPYTITIRNQSPNAITLKDPACNAPGAKVELREITAGKDFELVVRFSQEMAKDPDKSYQVTVNTSLASQPQVSIPVQFVHPPTAPPRKH